MIKTNTKSNLKTIDNLTLCDVSLYYFDNIYAESIRMRVSYLKARGNAAKGEMKNDQALKFYKDGLKLSKKSDILRRESAVLYTNISKVYSDLNNLQKALENATCATEMDSIWSKVIHYI